MQIKDLVGFQLVDINEEKIVVQKENTTYTLNIKQDYGDCCGFNEVTTELYMSKEELNRNPIITNVEVVEKKLDAYEDAQAIKVTFFGEINVMAILDSYSSSGSGWCYGACVSVICDELDLNETISCW